MVATKPQPISGVSAGYENVIETLYPSISAGGFGQFLGRAAVLWYVILAPLGWPLALTLYFFQKVFGDRYVVTNYSVQIWKAMGIRLLKQTPLSDIATITVAPEDGQAFYKAGNLTLRNAAGDMLLTLAGVPYPDRFRQVILEARDARMQTESSLAQIRARQSA